MDHLPGRLGNPDSTLITDKRLDPRIKAALEQMGALGEGIETPENPSYEVALGVSAAMEASGEITHPMQLKMMPEFPNVSSRTETIKGVDGNDILLFIHVPKTESDSPLPCLLHTHGGGMVIMAAADPGFVRLRNSIASQGIVVVGVEFRNGGGKLGNHPFPAGLNDCSSALQWIHDHRAELNISTVTIAGESGGGNLAIATTLKAKQDGNLEQVNGVYAMCPYISGTYSSPPPELLSLVENDGYNLDGKVMANMVKVYDPDNAHANNPLAWPFQASLEELAGLPPHIISVNELDPLRDEGLFFYRKLANAGNSVVARTVHGTQHAGDLSTPDLTPDIFEETLRSICGFVKSLK